MTAVIVGCALFLKVVAVYVIICFRTRKSMQVKKEASPVSTFTNLVTVTAIEKILPIYFPLF